MNEQKHDEYEKMDRRYRRTCDIVTALSAILLVVCIALLVWWFAWALT